MAICGYLKIKVYNSKMKPDSVWGSLLEGGQKWARSLRPPLDLFYTVLVVCGILFKESPHVFTKVGLCVFTKALLCNTLALLYLRLDFLLQEILIPEMFLESQCGTWFGRLVQQLGASLKSHWFFWSKLMWFSPDQSWFRPMVWQYWQLTVCFTFYKQQWLFCYIPMHK